MTPPAPDARALLEALGEWHLTLATAESLTGGMLGATITAVPGSSAVYVGGVVAYSARVKIDLLGVPAEVIAAHGVVSRECALAMAEGVRALTGADTALATTGVAGPGAEDGVPAGTVWVAAAAGPDAWANRLEIEGDRVVVRAATCVSALALLTAKFQPSA